jgi:hypothetical protein
MGSFMLLALLSGCSLIGKFFEEDDPSFHIELDYRGWSPSATEEAAIDEAVGRWEAVITEGLYDDSVEITQDMVDADGPDTPCRTYDDTVDDLIVFVSVDATMTAQAAGRTCLIREDSPYLTLAGGILVSPSLLDGGSASSELMDSFTHELGHVIGLKSGVWNIDIDDDGSWERNLLPGINSGCPSSQQIFFQGDAAKDAWQDLGGSGKVPMEDDRLLGTRCEHWDKDWFGSEVMTGWGSEEERPLSIVSVMALKDLGYKVDSSEADPFELTGLGDDTGE